ncbi:MAG: RluA family pseudouridine synthase [Treponema sp.]|jgi:23S rRNA pseudouridine955/2504/2580 synthase|nr:RluA family pseudouridine synthase [Treponema sp.]
MTLTAARDDDGRRLDRILRKALPDLPLSLIHRLLRQGRILVDGRRAGPAARVMCGAVITAPDSADSARRADGDLSPGAEGAFVPDILYEGAGICAVNKSAGIAVHGRRSLETAVRAYLAAKLPPSLSFTPGPLHRLDKPTSGVVVFSTGLEGARRFSALLAAGKLRKRYLAILEGEVAGPCRWEHRLIREAAGSRALAASSEGGKAAAASVTPLALSPCAPEAAKRSAAGRLTLALLEPETGRTHQLRLQAAAGGHPLWGDRRYGSRLACGEKSFYLHAWSLEFPPALAEGDFPRKIEAPLPAEFKDAIFRVFGLKYAPKWYTV